MKKIILIITILFTFVTATKITQAQVSVGVNINIGSQPVWGPVGYDYVDYYYLPDIDVYYYVPRHQYIYLSGGRWIFSAYLPVRYRSYDLYSGYKVVVNEPRPYLHANVYRTRYAPYRGRHDQVIIRNSNEPKYYVVKGHPKYNGHDNGNHNGGNKNGNGGNGRGNGGGNGKGKGHGKH
jgi:hypothetical protein